MSRYPEYRARRSSFGLDVLGTIVVEVEADSGEVGIGVSTGGVPACFIVERHLARFVEGADPRSVELMWDQMWRAAMFFRRQGLVLEANSAGGPGPPGVLREAPGAARSPPPRRPLRA